MICFVMPDERSSVMRGYLSHQGRALAGRMHVLAYEDLPHARRLPVATYVFAAVDRLCPAERELIGIICDRMAEADAPVRILNDPRQLKLGYDLLQRAFEAGLNTFRAYAATELVSHHRTDGRHSSGSAAELAFPVFVQHVEQRTGDHTPLLHDRDALERRLVSLVIRGARLVDLLVVEFCDTADGDGVYRKYSAFVVGARVMPRYLNTSRRWLVKHNTRIYEAWRADEELSYLESNPHAAWVREVSRLANVQYGRVDYALEGGRPQLWEIDTGPAVGRAGGPHRHSPEVERYRERVAPGRDRFYADLQAAWEAVDVCSKRSVAFDVPPALRDRIEKEKEKRRRLQDRASGRYAARLARFVTRNMEPAALRIAPLILRVLPPTS